MSNENQLNEGWVGGHHHAGGVEPRAAKPVPQPGSEFYTPGADGLMKARIKGPAGATPLPARVAALEAAVAALSVAVDELKLVVLTLAAGE